MRLKTGQPEEVGFSAKKISDLENLQAHWNKDGVSPIFVTLIARKGIIVSHKLFIDSEYNKKYGPYEIDAIFPLASISKTVTATAIMVLVDSGKIALNVPVHDYIPEFTGKNKEYVTLFHLITHTSGINEGAIYQNYNHFKEHLNLPEAESNEHPWIHEIMEAGYKIPLTNFPGSEMRYCNYGFLLLAEIIRRVTGQGLHDFINNTIFKPLGMKDSSFIVSDDQLKRVIQHPENAPFPNFSNIEGLKMPYAAGGLSSTAFDMAVYCQMYLNKGTYDGKRILSPASIKQITTNKIPGVSSGFGEELFKEASWGLGWNISGNKNDYTGILRSPETFSHSGRGNTLILVDPVRELVLINFQVTMKRIGPRAYHKFMHFTNAAIAAIEE